MLEKNLFNLKGADEERKTLRYNGKLANFKKTNKKRIDKSVNNYSNN